MDNGYIQDWSARRSGGDNQYSAIIDPDPTVNIAKDRPYDRFWKANITP